MMDAARYSASLDLDQLHEQAEHLAHALYLFFDAGASDEDNDTLTPERCIACRHFAWQLVHHVKRITGEYDKTYGPQPEGQG